MAKNLASIDINVIEETLTHEQPRRKPVADDAQPRRFKPDCRSRRSNKLFVPRGVTADAGRDIEAALSGRKGE